MPSFPHFPLRRTLSLDGIWDFAWAGDADLDALDPGALRFDSCAAVPGVFDADGSRSGARGVGAWRRRVEVPAAGAWRLDVGALGLRGRIWWDGRVVAEVATAYSHATCDLECAAGVHELLIAVDNRFDAGAASVAPWLKPAPATTAGGLRSPLFPAYCDFYAYGGIYRSVFLSELPPRRLERVTVTTCDPTAGSVRLAIRLGGAPATSVACTIAFDDGPAERLVAVPVDGRIILERRVPDPRPWTPEHPALHTVRVTIDGDTIVERFGLRTIAARGGAILLNGEPIRLRGVNRHEAHPQFGPVQPDHLLAEDLALMRELGCNFVRAVHYPHDQRFLDLCDQLGLLVWSESLAWGLDATAMARPGTLAQIHAQTRQMVEDGINHPSVVIWAFLNECASDTAEARPIYAELVQMVRSLDPSRLVSYASNRRERDCCFDLVDVVAINLYPGWLNPQPLAAWPEVAADRIAPVLAGLAEILSRLGKPMLVSEIGASALYGCRDRAAAQWSEEFQAGYMTEACRVILADPRWSGLALWQFCDTRSYIGYGEVRVKPRGFNNGGLLDEYRRPKLAWDAVKAVFTARSAPATGG